MLVVLEAPGTSIAGIPNPAVAVRKLEIVTDGAVPVTRAACAEPNVDQGDPFIFRAPDGPGTWRYYVIVTGPGFPVYSSTDPGRAGSWERMGESFPGIGVHPWAWAPCVRFVPGLERPWVMLYSLAAGSGDPGGHQFHRILRADSLRPEGPYADSGDVLTADLPFAIDPDVTLRADGSLHFSCAADYTDAAPYGTGLFEAPIAQDLRSLLEPLRPMARATADWQVYLPDRSMPWLRIDGVDWDRGDTVRWHTMEGPAGLVSPGGQDFALYSGGNFADLYAIGLLSRNDDGHWTDLSADYTDCLLSQRPADDLWGPGHCSVVDRYVAYHFRARPELPRQFALAELVWNVDDRPAIREEVRG